MVSPKTNFYLWDKIANNNQDVGGIGILGTNNVSNFDDAFRELMAQLATAFGSNLLSIAGDLFGLVIANNAGDIVNDIDIATGAAASDGASPIIMTLASAMTKRLDAAWVVGTNQGGLDTGVIANGTYHVFLIQRSDTGVVDAVLSASPTAPTMPANYDRKRRIASIMREAAANVPFEQIGDIFRRGPAGDRSSTAAAASILQTLSVPVGITVQPILRSALRLNISSSVANAIGNGTQGSAQYIYQQEISGAGAAVNDSQMIPPVFSTNTSAQVRFSATIGAGSIISNDLQTYGWIDTRGRLG